MGSNDPHDRRLVTTDDGSATLYFPQFDAHYHSTHGARQESEHVFINAGLSFIHGSLSNPSIRVLEMGMGTGLNVWLTALYAEHHQVNIAMTSIEAYPPSPEVIKQLDYASNPEEKALFTQIHSVDWDTEVQVGAHFKLVKLKTTFQEATLAPSFYDVVYFDAFAPRSQPELWKAPFLSMVCDRISPGGVLVTYCAQGAFKRALRSCGMEIEGIPGPPGKREMTRASKI
ncbi:MAG: tRNA (5-methylaminomethyl-2-thiouridine)(34)-methyltransferase MnmD [Bacteroidota bacterium]